MDRPTDRQTDSSIAICHPFLDGEGGGQKKNNRVRLTEINSQIKTADLHNVGIET